MSTAQISNGHRQTQRERDRERALGSSYWQDIHTDWLVGCIFICKVTQNTHFVEIVLVRILLLFLDSVNGKRTRRRMHTIRILCYISHRFRYTLKWVLHSSPHFHSYLTQTHSGLARHPALVFFFCFSLLRLTRRTHIYVSKSFTMECTPIKLGHALNHTVVDCFPMSFHSNKIHINKSIAHYLYSFFVFLESQDVFSSR